MKRPTYREPSFVEVVTAGVVPALLIVACCSALSAAAQNDPPAVDRLRDLFVSLSVESEGGGVPGNPAQDPEMAVADEEVRAGPEAPHSIKVLIPSRETLTLRPPLTQPAARTDTATDEGAVSVAPSPQLPGVRPHSPLLSGFQFSNTLRLYAQPSASSYQVSERGALDFAIRSFKCGFVMEGLKRDASTDQRPFRLEERYVEYDRMLMSGRSDLKIRVGTSTNVGFGSGLLLGAASLDGVSASYAHRDRITGVAFFGRARDLVPELYADDEFARTPVALESAEGLSVSGLRLALNGTDALRLGLSVVRIHDQQSPTADLHMGVSGSYDTRWLSLEGEAAFNATGDGTGAFLRMMLRPQRFTSVGLGIRDYRRMVNRVNLPPLYTGISGGNDTDDLGWFMTVDVSPWSVLSAGVDLDFSRKHDGTDRKRDALLRLQISPTSRLTSLLTWEVEHQDGRTPTIFTATTNYRLGGGGRISGRYSRDLLGDGPAHTVQLAAQYPLLDSRLTLLAEHALRRLDGDLQNTPQFGCTLRLWSGHFVTLRYSLESSMADSVSVTVFSRY